MSERKTFIIEFERMLMESELRALSNVSLERPLSQKEYKRMMALKEIVFEEMR